MRNEIEIFKVIHKYRMERANKFPKYIHILFFVFNLQIDLQ